MSREGPGTNIIPGRAGSNTAFQKSCFFVAELVFRQAQYEILTLSLSKGEVRRIHFHSEIPYSVFIPDLESLPG